MQCQMCDKSATVHLTEIVNGNKNEKHLCEQCANKEGITIKSHIPLNELLNNIVAAQEEAEELDGLSCPQCDLSWSDFRKGGLLGCPNDYLAFDTPLDALIKRAQEGATEHIGRIPRKSAGPVSRQVRLRKMQRDLQRAVEQEDYEEAAKVRDNIKHLMN